MRRFFNIVLTFSLIAPMAPAAWLALGPLPIPARQDGTVTALMAAMAPAEKVGQLFLVSFYGASAGTDSDIYRLITQYHVGGVVFLSANDNITDTANAPAQILALTNELQAAAVAASQIPRSAEQDQLPEQQLPPFIPLLIAVNHEGDGYPFTEIRSGMSELPSAMAIGATWQAEQAEAMGRIAGEELARLGINFLLGPSLDVLETPRPQGSDLGVRVFGGDPFWVGVMGQAYIRGVHAGSAGRVAVTAKHFPGHGGSDRRPAEEVPTVRKSFEQLQNFDLVPFFAVTGQAPDAASTADALLAAHIRFQGFQGNIRQNTQPVSFDTQAFGQLLALPPLAAWHANGGVTVSDSLGVRAVKRFYDPSEQSFNNRLIAREAFNAGNDLLLLSEFGLNPRQDQTEKIIDTLTYFTQRYEEDLEFALQVDAAVARILALKLRLHDQEFDPAGMVRPDSVLSVVGQERDKVLILARAAATLVSPTQDELAARAPEAPATSDHIVFFSDVRQGRQCSFCPAFNLFDRRRFEEVVLQLYGPDGSGEIRAGNLQSFSFDELADYLNAPILPPVSDETPTPEPPDVETALAQADWIVFSMLNVTPEVPASGVVSTFLAQRPDIVRSKKIIVFAFNAPYYLDTTDLSKLTAYYALYSKSAAFIDVAARLLFRELTPRGFPPVSVPSIGYDLIEATKPDPDRVIELFWEVATSTEEGTAQPPSLQLGDTITLTTGTIRDHNGHPVPDGTPVRFQVFYKEEGLPEFFDTQTLDGVASFPLLLDRIGELEITASSEPARLSFVLPIDVQQGTVLLSTPIVPTAEPSDTPDPTATPVPATLTVMPTITPVPASPPVQPGRVTWRSFFVMCLGLTAVVMGGYRLGMLKANLPRRGIRVALAGAIGTLAGYNYSALGLPGAGAAHAWLDTMSAPVLALVGGALGLAVGWYWYVQRGALAEAQQ